MNDEIKVGDRVTWQHPIAVGLGSVWLKWEPVSLKGTTLSGRVRELRRVPTFGGDLYAVIETDPDGRLTLPLVSKLAKAEATP